MNLPDIINSMFEALGGVFIMQHILKLHRDKLVRGVSWPAVGFFGAWGYWNLYYYPDLDQWWSFVGGIGIVTTNTIWFCQIVYYLYLEREGYVRRLRRGTTL